MTIKDIAKELGVSHTTVSRALRDSPDISEKVKEQVRRMADKLNYHVNDLARSLVTNKTQTIGLLVPDVANPFYSDLIKHLIEMFDAEGFRLLICNSGRSWEKEKQYLYSLLRQRVDGYIIISSNVSQKDFQAFLDLKLPVVLIDAHGEKYDVDSVIMNHYKGATEAVRLLIDSGYRRIAHITQRAYTASSQERLRGYRDVITTSNLRLDEEFIIKTDSTFEGGVEGSRLLLSLPKPPDAIFAVNDFVAMGVLQLFHSNGISVPSDIALIGYDDIYLARMLPVPLTTVHQSTYQLAREASWLLLDRLGNPERESCKNIQLEPKLIIRASCNTCSTRSIRG